MMMVMMTMARSWAWLLFTSMTCWQQDLPKLQCWMKGKDLSNGGPLTTYGSEVDSSPVAGGLDKVQDVRNRMAVRDVN